MSLPISIIDCDIYYFEHPTFKRGKSFTLWVKQDVVVKTTHPYVTDTIGKGLEEAIAMYPNHIIHKV